MKNFVVYDGKTGAVKRWGFCQDSMVSAQAVDASEGALEAPLTLHDLPNAVVDTVNKVLKVSGVAVAAAPITPAA